MKYCIPINFCGIHLGNAVDFESYNSEETFREIELTNLGRFYLKTQNKLPILTINYSTGVFYYVEYDDKEVNGKFIIPMINTVLEKKHGKKQI